ncbi:MAG: IS1595 family transposase, partial [Desulfosarcinaceae bacterium]|nr:IS1595 family transposase [Desulfosarcinaceae bacterium]
SSVVMARLIGVTQPTAWRMGHAIRKMMDPQQSDGLLLQGVVELDETYVGGQPDPANVNKRGKGTSKQ